MDEARAEGKTPDPPAFYEDPAFAAGLLRAFEVARADEGEDPADDDDPCLKAVEGAAQGVAPPAPPPCGAGW